jgi:class 3 adenylate cyclase
MRSTPGAVGYVDAVAANPNDREASTVRVTESAREAIGDPAGIEWSAPEARKLKGIRAEVRLYGARRRSAAGRRKVIGPAGSA